MARQQNEGSATTFRRDPLTPGLRVLGVAPLAFFVLHAHYHVSQGTAGHLLWTCTISNLLLAAGLFLGLPVLIRVAVMWLILGLPLWTWDMMEQGVGPVSTFLTHVGGLTLGLLALSRVRAARRQWAYAFIWYLTLQLAARLVARRVLNVNLAHDMYGGWHDVFHSYWKFWLFMSSVVAAALWLTGLALLRLFPPRMNRSRQGSCDGDNVSPQTA